METTGHATLIGINGGRRAVLHCVCILLAILSLFLTQLWISWADRPSPADVFPIEVTMDRWTSYIDAAIPSICIIFLCFSLVTVFQRNYFGPVCCNPEVHPPWFYLTLPVICVTDIVGLFLWRSGEILPALFMRLLPPALSFYMLFVSYNNLKRCRPLLHITSSWFTWFTYYATQNSLALSAWWTLTNALVNLGVVLKYTIGLQDPLVSSVVLTLLFLAMLLWFILQTFVLVKYIRYTFTVYPILIMGLGAMFTRGYQVYDMAPNTIYCGFLMVVATIMNCIMLFSLCCDSRGPSTSTHKPFPRLKDCPSVCQSVEKLGTEKAKGNMA